MRSITYLPVAILLLVSGIVRGQEPSVHLELDGVPTDLVCETGGDYRFIGTNGNGVIGSFALRVAGSGNPVSGHITDLGNNTAIFNPAGLNDGNYQVVYSFTVGQITTSIPGDFTVTLLDNIEIQGLPEIVCKNDSPYPLVPVPSLSDPGATYTFSGPGVSGTQVTGYHFDPSSSQVPVGLVQINLFYNSSLGCHTQSTISINTSAVPDLSFTTVSSCIPATGGEVQFTNLTSGQYTVETWSWNFGDPESGPSNVSNETNPSHTYPRPGVWNVSLGAVTYDGCQSNAVRAITLSDQPQVDFTWVTDCFVSGENTAFLDRSTSPYATIDDLLWTFRTTGGGVLGQIQSNNPEDTVEFPFASMNDYRVTLEVENDRGCGGSLTKTISLKPLYTLTTDGYLETFNDQPDDWFVDSEDGLESWVLGEPDFTGFSPVTGDLAWYTDLPESAVYLENSWVESPCFDLRALSSPLLQLDIMRSFVPGVDGAVVQYQNQVSEGWMTLGVVGGGINWYNSFGIFNKPGGSSFGWGLSEFSPDVTWLKAGNGVDVLSDVSHLKFRVAIGTGGTQAQGNDGFAFDNFYIGEGVKNSVLEYFTNSASTEAAEADDLVQEFVEDNSRLVIDLQYHMDYPGEDPMNHNNPEPPSVRAFNYGVPGVPYAVLNGGSGPEYRYDFSDLSEIPNEEDLKKSSLEVSPFDMKLDANFLSGSLNGHVEVTCKEEDFDSNIQLYVVVIESLVTAYTGANQTTAYRNVVLDILPSAGGKLLGNEWGNDISQNIDFKWDYAPYVEDVEDLFLVAFIMDRDHNKILQSSVQDYNPGTGSEDRKVREHPLAIYPVPARDYVYVNFGSETEISGMLRITDLSGRVVLSSELRPGYSIQRLDVSKLSEGLYLVQWIDQGLIKGQGKIIRSY